MTLKQKLNDYYRRQIEEHYAPFIKEKLSELMAAGLNERPADVKVVKNKSFDSPQITGEPPVKIKYHQLDLGGFYRAVIVPQLDLIEISHKKGKSEESFKAFLKFSIQKELFADLTPIKKANIEDAELIEEFITDLRNTKL